MYPEWVRLCMKHPLWFAFLVFPVIGLILVACAAPPSSGPGQMCAHVQGEICVESIQIAAPAPFGEPTAVTVTVRTASDVPGLQIILFTTPTSLPQKASEPLLVDGELTWRGALEADVPIRFSARIKFIREGTFLLIASARTYEAGGQGIGQGDGFRLFVSQSEGRFAVPAPASGSGPIPPPPPLTPPPPQPSPSITRER